MLKYFLDNLQNYEGEIGGHHSKKGTTEDGNDTVAMHIFDSIGIEYRHVLDIGAFSTKASNVIPIMKKYGIEGLLLDGENKYHDPKITKVWLEVDNILNILENLGCPKKLDYISIDIDNMDYWILEKVLSSGYDSNLIIVEFNPIWSHSEAYVKKYYKNAKKGDEKTGVSSNYGASLRAFSILLSKFDYRLIHVVQKCYESKQPTSNNAFFIKSKFDHLDKFKDHEDVIKELLPEPFVEGAKMKRNMSKFKTADISQIKEILKNNFFIEVKMIDGSLHYDNSEM
jgi:hypothetical protein